MKCDFAPPYFVRLAGFSFHHVEHLGFNQSAQSYRDWARLLNSFQAGQQPVAEALTALNPRLAAGDNREERKALKRTKEFVKRFLAKPHTGLSNRAVSHLLRHQPSMKDSLHSLLKISDSLTKAHEKLERTFAEELEHKRVQLQTLFAEDPRLQESVFIQSSNAYRGLCSWWKNPSARNAKTKRRERTAIMYLQRFCAKNDSHSMCGPISLSWLDSRDSDTRFVLEDELAIRKTYFSHWASELLCIGEPSERLIRLNPTTTLDDDFVRWGVFSHDSTKKFRRQYRRLPPNELLEELTQALEQPRSLSELSEHLLETLGIDPEESESLLDELLQAGLILDHPQLPFGDFEPLDRCRTLVAARPPSETQQQTLQTVEQLHAHLQAFSSGDLPTRLQEMKALNERFEAHTGEASARSHGQIYADRTLLHEDCYSQMQASLSASIQAQLKTPIELLCRVCSLPLDLRRERVRAWYAQTFPKNRPVSALEVHRLFDQDQPAERTANTPKAAALKRAIFEAGVLLDNACDQAKDGRAQLHSDDLRRILKEVPEQDRPGYASIDLMLCRREEGYLPVIGELHGLFLMTTDWLDLVPSDEGERALRALHDVQLELSGGKPTVEPLFRHTQATDRRLRVASQDLVIIGPAAAESPAIPFGALTMSMDDQGLHFWHDSQEVVPICASQLYPFFFLTSPVAPLLEDSNGKFFPIELFSSTYGREALPRLELDGLVFGRQRWVLERSATLEMLEHSDALSLFQRAQRLRARLGCPRFVFASISEQPKPLLVDFENLFLLEALLKCLKDAPESQVKFSEMLPGPDDLCLLGEDGPRTFELRMGLYRSPS